MLAVVVRGPDPSRLSSDRFRHIEHVQAGGDEPLQLLNDLIDAAAPEANQDVEHLRFVDARKPGLRIPAPQERLDRICGRFADQKGNNRLRVEDRQLPLLRRSASRSSRRIIARASSVVGPGPAREARAAATGSDGRGRITMAPPWSSRSTVSTFHRCRTSAGT